MSFRSNTRTASCTLHVVRGVALAAALAVAPAAHAVLYWDQDSNLGGNGTWDVNNTQNWRTTNIAGAPDAKWFPNDGTQDAAFNGPGTANYTVTIASGTTINLNSLSFGILSSPATTARNITVTGGTVINIASPTSSIVMNTNTQGVARAQVLASSISGTNITVVANPGTINSFLTLGASGTGLTNTFSGDLIFGGSAGTTSTFSQININNPTALPSTATVRMKRDFSQLLFTAAGFSGTNAYSTTFNNNIVLNDGVTTATTATQSIGSANVGSVITLGGVISGNADLSFKVGAGGGQGAIVLANHETYTGASIIGMAAVNGTVRLGIDNALPVGTTLFANVGTFNMNGFNQKVGALSSQAVGASPSAFITNTGATTSTLTIDGNVTGSCAGLIGAASGGNDNIAIVMASTNTGTLTLNRNIGSTYNGGTTINGGKLLAANDISASLSATGNGPVAVNSGGTLGGGGGVGGTAGTGLVTVASGGHLAPSNDTSTTVGAVTTILTGPIGTLTAFSGLTLGGGSKLDMDLGAPVFGASGTSDRIDMPGTYGNFAVTVPATANSIGVNLSDPGGTAGNGTYTLMSFQAGQYTGSSNASQFFTGSLPSPNSLNGATIAYHLADNSNVIQDGSPASATRVIMTVTGGPNALTWTGASSGTWDTGITANFNSATTGTSSTFAGNDDVTFNDTGANTNPVTIDAGGVQPNMVAINNSSTTYTFSGGDIKGSSLGGGGGLFFSGTGGVTINNNYTVPGPITSNKTGGTATINGTITAATGITVNGGTLTLAGANTYTGNNTVNGDPVNVGTTASTKGGVLAISADNNLGAVPGSPTANSIVLASGTSLNDGGTLQTTASFTLNANRGITVSAVTSVLSNAPGTTLTYGGVLSGTGGLTQTGGGTLLLTGNANTYTGNTTVRGGAAGSTLKIGIDNALPTGTQLNINGVVNGGNAMFDLNGFNQTVSGIALIENPPTVTTAGGTITNSAGGAAKNFTVNNSLDKFFAGVISGNLNLVKNNTGTLTLTGANTYTGDTKDLGVGGKLSISTPYLADAADVYLVSGSTFGLDFSAAGTTDTIRSLFIDNMSQATGTWGAPGSGAAHTSSLFSGIGLLNVTVAATLNGDYNGDGKVDAADYVMWRKNPSGFGGDPAGYNTWRANFGNPPGAGSGLAGGAAAVPEPSALSLVVLSFGLAFVFGRRNTER